MENVVRRGQTYYVRVTIPEDVRHAFKGKTSFGQSLRTKDENLARERAAPIISDIKRRIQAARSPQVAPPSLTPPAPPPFPDPIPFDADSAWAAIQRWQKRTIDDGYRAHFLHTAPTFSPFGDEAVELSKRIHSLQGGRYGQIARFDDALVAALVGEGIPVQIGHPSIPDLRGWFGEAWLEAEGHFEKFRRRNFNEWSAEPAPTPATPLAPSPSPPPPATTSQPQATLISHLLARFIAAHKLTPKDTSEIRGYVARLIQEFGDLPISEVSTDAAGDHGVALPMVAAGGDRKPGWAGVKNGA